MRMHARLIKKTLRHALTEMERHGLVRKEVRFSQGLPARSTRSRPTARRSPIVGAMYEWGLQHALAPSARRRTFLIGAGPAGLESFRKRREIAPIPDARARRPERPLPEEH